MSFSDISFSSNLDLLAEDDFSNYEFTKSPSAAAIRKAQEAFRERPELTDSQLKELAASQREAIQKNRLNQQPANPDGSHRRIAHAFNEVFAPKEAITAKGFITKHAPNGVPLNAHTEQQIEIEDIEPSTTASIGERFNFCLRLNRISETEYEIMAETNLGNQKIKIASVANTKSESDQLIGIETLSIKDKINSVFSNIKRSGSLKRLLKETVGMIREHCS